MKEHKKLRVGVIFGGRSAEHEVSLVSAVSVMNALDRKKYDVVPIGISAQGRWLSAPNAIELLKSRGDLKNIPEKILLPDPTKRDLVTLGAAGVSAETLDVIFPVVHGTYGEDGTLQGLLELANMPYVGGGVLGSSVGMDKVISKKLFEDAGIPTAPYHAFLLSEYDKNPKPHIVQIELKLGYPCFVKPANAGSSVGVSKARNREELLAAILLALDYDRKVLVERAVRNPREIEFGVLGNDDPMVSIAGEIIPSNEFYDYDAKYVDGKSTAIIPAKLNKTLLTRMQKHAAAGFKAIDCAGMARVDFLLQRDTQKIYLNEINTIPGFTSISMYPKLWEASGIGYVELLDRLIALAIERNQAKNRLKTVYTPKTTWYKEG